MARLELERYNRVIRNIYTAVFEREVDRRGTRLYRRTFQIPAADIVPYDRQGYMSEVLRDYPRYYVPFDGSKVYDTPDTLNRQKYHDFGQNSDLWGNYAVSGAPTMHTDTMVDGARGSALVLGTTASYVQALSSQSGHYYTDFTFECVLQFSANPTASAVVKLIDVGPVLSINDQRKLVLTNASADTERTATTALTAGTRYHVVWTRNIGESLSRLYVNGEQVDSWAATSTYQKTAVATPTIGVQTGANWGGTFILDEVAVYKHALTATRVAAHYARLINGSKTYPAGAVQFHTQPYPTYYADLTTGGTNSSDDDSAYRFATGVTVTHPYGGIVFGQTSSGVVRLRPRWAYTAAPTNPTILRVYASAGNYLELFYDSSANRWTLRRWQAGSGTDATVAGSHIENQDVTIGWWMTGSQLGISLDGGALTVVSNSRVPSGLSEGTDAEIGNGTNPSNCNIHWLLTNVDSPGETDFNRWVAKMHELGNYDPNWDDLPYGARFAQPCFLWWGRGAAHQPTAILDGSFAEP